MFLSSLIGAAASLATLPGTLEMEGPSSTVKRFDLEEGSRIRILEEKENWIRLLDSENRDGWVPAEGLGKI